MIPQCVYFANGVHSTPHIDVLPRKNLQQPLLYRHRPWMMLHERMAKRSLNLLPNL
jgi:hypothetical protein